MKQKKKKKQNPEPGTRLFNLTSVESHVRGQFLLKIAPFHLVTNAIVCVQGPTRIHVQLIMERLLRRVNRTVIAMDTSSPLIVRALTAASSAVRLEKNALTKVLPQGHYLACMTAVLKQMDDMHYAHHISTFKTRQDIIVSVPGSSSATSGLINNAH